jgi:hypothetical protein
MFINMNHRALSQARDSGYGSGTAGGSDAALRCAATAFPGIIR